MARIDDIVVLLREASEAYYNGDAPVISDAEYDLLRDELSTLDPANTFLKEVGAAVSDDVLKKAKHSMPMGSLDKVNTPEEFETWLKSTIRSAAGDNPNMVAQCKYDGSSIELVYKGGKFVQAITRGDGLEGEDVTHTIKNAKGFPRVVNNAGDFFVRCEAILSVADWKQYFPGEKNPRNSSNGTVRRTDTRGSEHLHCIAFNVLSASIKWATRTEKIEWLANNGFEIALSVKKQASDIPSYVSRWENDRKSFQFEIDGMVIHLDDETIYEKMGDSDNRPYAARAWKFPPMGGHSVLENVTWDVGTTGKITPVAVIKPLDVGGVTITNVTLHNMSEIERKDVHIGDTVEVVRAGDVIPYIVRVVTPGSTRTKIEQNTCPGCGGTVVRDGPFLRCSVPTNCAGTQVKRIKGWIRKRDIMFLGDSNLDMLIKGKAVKAVRDLYFLTVDSMVGCGLGKRMAEKILAEIQKSMNVAFHDLVGSLSIDLLGRRQAKHIVEAGTISLVQWESLTVEQLMQYEGFQDTKSSRIIHSLKDAWPVVKELAGMLNVNYGLPKKASASGANTKLKGATFCFTGRMEKDRKELQSLVDANGGKNLDSVNSDLTYLVIEDINSDSAKAKKARKLGTKLLSEAEFLGMVLN